jgi:dolichyl-diphosphooligosaccharide--protein glycosyltransferase
MIIGTLFLFLSAHYLKGKERFYYPIVLICCAIIFGIFLFFVSPNLYNLLINDFFAFFGQQPVTNTVQEARGWSLDFAWQTFNYGLFLMAGGALVMLYNNIRDEYPHQIFALVWSVVVVLSTWQHVRYEYYLAVNIALLAAVCISFLSELGWDGIRNHLLSLLNSQHTSDSKKQASDKETGNRLKKTLKREQLVQSQSYIPMIILILASGLGILFVFTSVSYSFANASSNAIKMNDDWKESLEWMANNTPNTGVNYNTIYNPKTFQYPPESYGVMSWWDYGHMITYIAKRIPNANPFQQGVAGQDGAAAYFVTTSEDTANTILDHDGTRYVITDIEMDTGKFWAMATWDNATLGTSSYQETFLTTGRDNPNMLESVLLNNQQYYLTMISRLHNFDGSMAQPSTVYYIEYADPEIAKVSLPVITAATATNVSDAQQRVDQYNLKAVTGYHATVLSPSIVNPVGIVPALKHYRLVHESSSNVFNAKTPDVKYVKVFEYVKGAHIKGEGIISVPVMTNTGRQYNYTQSSVNGEFIVPYSTSGNSYGVKTTGKYQILGTGRQYDVPESAIIQGTTIS